MIFRSQPFIFRGGGYFFLALRSKRITCSLKNDGWKTIRLPFEMVPFHGRFVHFRGCISEVGLSAYMEAPGGLLIERTYITE